MTTPSHPSLLAPAAIAALGVLVAATALWRGGPPAPPRDPTPAGAAVPAPAPVSAVGRDAAVAVEAAPAAAPVPAPPAHAPPPPAPGRPLTVARDEASAGPEAGALAARVRAAGRDLFLDVPRGREAMERLLDEDWPSTAQRERLRTGIGPVLALLAAGDPAWTARSALLGPVAAAARQGPAVAADDHLARAVDAELRCWRVAAAALPRLRLALSDPRSEARALRELEALPGDREAAAFARDAFAVARLVDQPHTWARVERARGLARARAGALRLRLEHEALALVLGEELWVALRTLERQLADPQASLPAALEAVLLQDPAAAGTAFVTARRRELTRDEAALRLRGWGLALTLPASLGPSTVIDVSIDDEGLAVRLTGDGRVALGQGRLPLPLRPHGRVVIERGVDALIVRDLATGTTARLPLRERAPGPAGYRVTGPVAGVSVVQVPPRTVSDPRRVRGDPLRAHLQRDR